MSPTMRPRPRRRSMDPASITSPSRTSTTNCCCGSTASLVHSKAARPTTPTKVFGDRRSIRTANERQRPGRPRPGRHRCRDAKLAVSRLQVWRESITSPISWDRTRPAIRHRFRTPLSTTICSNLPTNPTLWDRFGERQKRRFPARQGPIVRDGRQQRRKLRRAAVGEQRPAEAQPGGAYLERGC